MTQSFLTHRHNTVVALYNAATTSAKGIARALKLPVSTCYRYVKQLHENGQLPPARRTGRRPILTPRKVKLADKTVKKNPHATAKQVRNILQKKFPITKLSVRTVCRTLADELNYKHGKAITLPLLNARQIEKRLNFCKEYENDPWDFTIFSDETTLQMLRNTLTVRWKKGQPRPGAPSLKHPYKCFFWGAISVHGTIGFHLWDNQNLDGALYRWIIRAKLLRQANKKMGKYWRFQHDNDPKHTANATKEVFAEHGN